MNDPNIYQRINAVMTDCEYVQKKAAQQGKGVKYDEVIAMLRDLLIKHGVVMVVRQKEMTCIGGVEGTKQKVYQGLYEMDLINMDKPDEIVTHSAYSHGMDGGDKAPGKAHTYAVKIMLIKGFGIETGEDEESRSEKIDRQNTISASQIDQLARYCLVSSEQGIAWSAFGLEIAGAYKINVLDQLPASKFDEVLKICKDRI